MFEENICLLHIKEFIETAKEELYIPFELNIEFSKLNDNEESRLIFKENKILVNEDLEGNHIKTLQAIVYQMRHIFQILYCTYIEDARSDRWLIEFQGDVGPRGLDSTELRITEIEIDAYAYLRYFFKEFTIYQAEIKKIKGLDKLLDKYIEANLNIIDKRLMLYNHKIITLIKNYEEARLIKEDNDYLEEMMDKYNQYIEDKINKNKKRKK